MLDLTGDLAVAVALYDAATSVPDSRDTDLDDAANRLGMAARPVLRALQKALQEAYAERDLERYGFMPRPYYRSRD